MARSTYLRLFICFVLAILLTGFMLVPLAVHFVKWTLVTGLTLVWFVPLLIFYLGWHYGKKWKQTRNR